MSKLRHKPEQIIRKLRQAEVLSGQGKNVEEICCALGVSDATYYKWRKEYGGMGVSQAKRLKELESKNALPSLRVVMIFFSVFLPSPESCFFNVDMNAINGSFV